MSHVLKVFLRVIHSRVYHKLEEQVGNIQFGFRRGLGTREALFSLQVLGQRARDMGVDVYLCFIDFEKAFDWMRHKRMVEVLQRAGIDERDCRFIANLYWKQKTCVRVGNSCTEEVDIRRGVRQGCILSPILFNLYSEHILREALEGTEDGVRINGVLVNNIRYADDTVILADIEGLQRLMDRVTAVCEGYGLRLNVNKTKYMIVTRYPDRVQDIGVTAYGRPLQRVNQITYLGTLVSEDWDHTREIRVRIERARATYTRMERVLRSRDLSLELRTR